MDLTSGGGGWGECRGMSLDVIALGHGQMLECFRLKSDTVRFGFCTDRSACQWRTVRGSESCLWVSEARVAQIT